MDLGRIIREGAVLDVRPRPVFLRAHFRGAVSHPLPEGWSEESLDQDLPSIFLPPRHEPLTVVASDQAEATRLAALLAGRGRAEVHALAFVAHDVDPGLISSGPSRRHLWRPPLWLEHAEPWLPPPAKGPVLDLACGSGRAAVWLAEKGYRVVGVDWQPEALELGRRLAADRGVACDFRPGDLRGKVEGLDGPWAILLNFRFLQRELLTAMSDRLLPGGVAVVRTFRQAPGYEGHPHPRHRLGPGELLKAFPAARCEILMHEENHDDDGRPAAGVVARRRIT